jgi:hypothetical protein
MPQPADVGGFLYDLNRFSHRWMRYGMDCSFATGDFKMEKRVRDH